MAGKASFADQQMLVQENVHSQIKAFCTRMNESLLPNEKVVNDHLELSQQANNSPHHSAKGKCDDIPSDFISILIFPFFYLSFCNILLII